jgi:hypothetical protein
VESDEQEEAYTDPVPVDAIGIVVLKLLIIVAQTTDEGVVVIDVNVLVAVGVAVTLAACVSLARTVNEAPDAWEKMLFIAMMSNSRAEETCGIRSIEDATDHEPG